MRGKLLIMLSTLLVPQCIHAQAADFETATEAVKNMKVGINLVNTLDCNSGDVNWMWIEAWTNRTPTDYETAWGGNPVTRADLMKMWRKAGYHAVRVPVTWYPHTGKIVIKMVKNEKGEKCPTWDMATWEGYDIDPVWMKRVHEVVDYVIDQGMYCILNVHHDTGDYSTSWLRADADNYEQNHERFEAIWRQIAEEFKDYDDHLLFEGYNEMLDKFGSWGYASLMNPTGYDEDYARSSNKALNDYAQSFVNVVRSTGGNNLYRNLVVNTYCGTSGGMEPLTEIKVPQDEVDGHLLIGVHAYYTFASLETNKNTFDNTIQDLNTYLVPKGVPIIVSEWGTNEKKENREAACDFAHYFMEKTRANGLAVFDWSGVVSYGKFRSLPAFDHSAFVVATMKGYYGDNYEPVLLTRDDYDDEGKRKQFVHTVEYNTKWSELNLFSDDVPLKMKNYKGLRVVFAEPVSNDNFHIKVYGDDNTVEDYLGLETGLTTTNPFQTRQVHEERYSRHPAV